jgi:hypothetical protein
LILTRAIEIKRIPDGLPHPIILEIPSQSSRSAINATEVPLTLTSLKGFFIDKVLVKLATGVNITDVSADLRATKETPILDDWFQLDLAGNIDSALANISQDPRILDWYREVEQIYQQKQFTDPLFDMQWHLVNTGQQGGTKGQDISADSAWTAGASGKGVIIQFVDTGIDYTHPDLKSGYVQAASYDLNDGDDDPMPTSSSETHGTSCAAIAVATADNGVCGVGVAYQGKFGAIRLLTKPISATQQAQAMTSYSINTGVSISSNSWGYEDTGVSFDPTRNQYFLLVLIYYSVCYGRCKTTSYQGRKKR